MSGRLSSADLELCHRLLNARWPQMSEQEKCAVHLPVLLSIVEMCHAQSDPHQTLMQVKEFASSVLAQDPDRNSQRSRRLIEKVVENNARFAENPQSDHALESLMSIVKAEYASDTAQENLKCSVCHTTAGKIQQCSQCKRVLYCSIACQRKDWGSHKVSCMSPVSK